MRAHIPTIQHGISAASSIRVTVRASSVPWPLLEARFLVHVSENFGVKQGGGGTGPINSFLVHDILLKQHNDTTSIWRGVLSASLAVAVNGHQPWQI